MSELRYILVALGVALLLAIYVWGRTRKARSEPASPTVARREPSAPDYSRLDSPARLRVAESAVATQDRSMDADTEPLDIESIDEDIDEPASGTSAPGFPAQHSEVPDAKVSVPDMRVAASTTPQSRATGAPRREPGLGPMQRADIARASVRPEPSLPDGQQSPEPNIEKGGLDDAGPRDLEDRAKRVFAVRLVAPSGHRYSGKDLMAQFNSQRLEHGRYGIFHSIGHSGNSIFSVASMIEPGTFDLDSIAGTEYPGLTLFTLVGSSDDARSVEALLECATNLQRSLGGTFQDERGTGISSSRLDEMRLQARSAGT